MRAGRLAGVSPPAAAGVATSELRPLAPLCAFDGPRRRLLLCGVELFDSLGFRALFLLPLVLSVRVGEGAGVRKLPCSLAAEASLTRRRLELKANASGLASNVANSLADMSPIELVSVGSRRGDTSRLSSRLNEALSRQVPSWLKAT